MITSNSPYIVANNPLPFWASSQENILGVGENSSQLVRRNDIKGVTGALQLFNVLS